MTDHKHVTSYSRTDAHSAPDGHFFLPGTDVEVVVYPSGGDDLVVTVNKAGRCVYRALIADVLPLHANGRGNPRPIALPKVQ